MDGTLGGVGAMVTRRGDFDVDSIRFNVLDHSVSYFIVCTTRASAKWVRADKDKRIVPPTKLRALDNERIRWTVDIGRLDTRDESHLKGMPSTESAAPHRPRGNTDRGILTKMLVQGCMSKPLSHCISQSICSLLEPVEQTTDGSRFTIDRCQPS